MKRCLAWSLRVCLCCRGDKKGVVYLSDFLTIIVFPAHPLLKHMGVKRSFVGTGAKSDDRLRTQKTEEQMCGAKSPTFPQPHGDTAACIQCLPCEHPNLIVWGNMSYFKILMLHYLRCLLRATVTARQALTRLSDCAPLLHVMYECTGRTYFSLPRHNPQRRLLKKNLNYPRETTGPCQARAEGRRKSGERQRKKGSGERGCRLEGGQGKVSDWAPDPARRRRRLCPVNWNTKQRGGRWEYRWRGGGGAAVCLQQCSTFTAGWELTGEPASETDTLSLVKWTVTLHFSTAWHHRIGRFEPCDVTLIEFCPLLPPAFFRKKAV